MTSENPDPCDLPERRQFDFWTGEWDLTWEGGRGGNHIVPLFEGCAIQEHFHGVFDGEPKTEFSGTSLSAYDARRGEWGQTWVDSQGGYLDFRGGMQGERMILSRTALIDGEQVLQRMVWYNIGNQSLDWNWERSQDGGDTWQVLWHIHYQRRPAV